MGTLFTPADVADIRKRLANGEHQHDIAASYKVNQGRISEIKTGKTYSGVSTIDQEGLGQ